MSKRVTKKKTTKKKERAHPNRKYDWDDWFKKLREGRELTFRKGKDFKCATRSFYIQIRSEAWIRDVRISSSVIEGGLGLRVSLREE